MAAAQTSDSILIFLDFDGVLRRLNSPPDQFDLDCLQHFETAIKALAHTEIVISSSWRLAYGLQDIKARFSVEVAARIIGVTPEATRLTKHYRHDEVLGFLHQAGRPDAIWLAIDDATVHFPGEAHVIITDAYTGFSAQDAIRLHAMVSQLPSPSEI